MINNILVEQGNFEEIKNVEHMMSTACCKRE